MDLSRRQVELLSRKPRGRFDDTVAGEIPGEDVCVQSFYLCALLNGLSSSLFLLKGGLEQLAQDMQKLCSMIAEVS